MSEQEQGQAQTAETVEGGSPQGAETRVAIGSGGDGGADLEKVRGLVLQAHPEVVPDLVRGATIDELIASVEPARAAYQRVAEQVRGGQGAAAGSPQGVAEPGGGGSAQGAVTGETKGVVPPPAVPAGGAANVVDPANIPASEKIRRGLEAARKR